MSDRLFQLYESMYQDGIKLFDYRLIEDKAATIKLYGKYAVFLDTCKIDSIADEICTMAHEYGHCKTGSTHSVYSPFDLVCKHEYKADKWAVHEYIKFEEYQQAIQDGYTEVWQLADRFNVTEDFIRRADYIYRCEEKIA